MRQIRSLLLYTWSLSSWIWQIFELPAKHVPPQQLPTAVFPSDKIIYPLIVAVLIQVLHCPRNPLVCLCPRLQAGTPLHLHPMESWETDVSGDLCRVRCYWMREILTWKGFHLACTDQFVIFKLRQLSSQCEVRVHQEGLSATLVEILERQSCKEELKCYNGKAQGVPQKK